MPLFDDWCQNDQKREQKKHFWKLIEKAKGREAVIANAAVDFLGIHDLVDRERIGGIGICGSAGFIVSAAEIDPRLKAIATVSMYDMGSVTRTCSIKSNHESRC